MPSRNRISARACAPATVANVSCGFDIFGFAVEQPCDEVVVSFNGRDDVRISSIEGDAGRLPSDARQNTAGVAVIEYLKALGSQNGVDIALKKKLPLGSGMGSSAASAVAALVAVNELFAQPFSRKELLPFAMEAERVACGSAHADNVAPALFGGFILVRGYGPLDVVSIPVPEQLYCTLVHPHMEIKTEDSRLVLRSSIPLKDAVAQWGNIAGLVAGLMKPDFGLISRSLNDVVAEPVRSLLIPGFETIKVKAVGAGALGCGISGSGPTIFCLSTEKGLAHRSGLAVQEVFRSFHVESELYVSKINHQGAALLEPTKQGR